MELLLGLLTKTLNMSEDEFKSLIYKEDSETELKENALQLLLEKDASRITSIKDKFKTEKDDQYKRGLREASERWEKDIRNQFGLSQDLKGEELIAEAVKTKQSDGGEDGDLTEDKVKAHPMYIALQNAKKNELEQANKDWQAKLDQAQNEFATKATVSTVRQKALDYIKSKGVVLPPDAAKANKRLSAIFPELDQYSYESNGDEIIVKNKEGHQLVDPHDNVITFTDLVDGIAEDYFDFNEDGGNGNDNNGGNGNGTNNRNDFGKGKFSKVKVPTNPEELQKALDKAKTSEERSEISKAYLEAQKTD